MKTFATILIPLALIASGLHAQKTDFIFQTLDANKIASFFSGSVSIGNSKIKWKPDASEKQNFSVSDDGYCYSETDTIIRYHNNGEKAIMVFSSYGVQQGKRNDCMACAPMLSMAMLSKMPNGSWKAESFFKKFVNSGANGKPGKMGLIKTGKETYSFQLAESGGQGGQWMAEESFYSLTDLHQVFTFSALESADGLSGGTPAYQTKAEIKFITSSNKYFDIEETIKGTKLNSEGNKAVPANEKKLYSFDEKSGVYKEVIPAKTPPKNK